MADNRAIDMHLKRCSKASVCTPVFLPTSEHKYVSISNGNHIDYKFFPSPWPGHLVKGKVSNYINRHCGSIFLKKKKKKILLLKRRKIIVILENGSRRKGREGMRAHVHYFFQRQGDVPFMSEKTVSVL